MCRLLDRVSNLSIALERRSSTPSIAAAVSKRLRTGHSPALMARGFRGIYDLADPEKSRFTITTGQSGHIFSPHYRDFVPLWNDGKSITMTGSEDELKRAGARQLTLRP